MSEEIQTINYHLFDARGVYTGTVEIDPVKALPARGTVHAVPDLEAGEFAIFAGGGWTVTTEEPPFPAAPAISPDAVDAERDRRITDGFTFGGVAYQYRDEDRENIAGAAVAALAAMMAGAQPNDLQWHGGASDFVWIAADNSLNPMDAQTMFAFGQAAMAHKQAHIFAARAIKDADPIPADFTDDGYWP